VRVFWRGEFLAMAGNRPGEQGIGKAIRDQESGKNPWLQVEARERYRRIRRVSGFFGGLWMMAKTLRSAKTMRR